MKSSRLVIAVLAVAVVNLAVAVFTARSAEAEVTKAICILQPTAGNGVKGVVTFTKVEGGIKVEAQVTGLTPGNHGFHVHEFGDCTAPDGASAGGHFNPHAAEHAGPMAEMRHVGDLGNLEADASGNATVSYVDKMVAFSGENNILGRGIIVHEKADDFKTQPTGAAGARVAHGVIGVAKAE